MKPRPLRRKFPDEPQTAGALPATRLVRGVRTRHRSHAPRQPLPTARDRPSKARKPVWAKRFSPTRRGRPAEVQATVQPRRTTVHLPTGRPLVPEAIVGILVARRNGRDRQRHGTFHQQSFAWSVPSLGDQMRRLYLVLL